MKKHIKKIMGMGLACMLFLGVPFQASAAEVTGTLSTETSGEDGAADGADNSSDAAANPDSGADSSTPDAGTAADNPAAANDKADDNVVIKESDKPYLALGADLSEDQKNTVLSLMGIDPAQLGNYDVVTVSNSEEHQYLDAYIPSSQIGSKSWSSVVIVKKEKGNGINISTKNISYCTVGMYKNALVTAGIEDADIIVAGPKNISGTAALVGVFKAYQEMTGKELPQENVDTALNELVLTGQLESSTGADAESVEGLVAYLKQQIAENGLTDDDSIRKAIDEAADKFDVTLTEDQKAQLLELLKKIGDLDLDVDSLVNQKKYRKAFKEADRLHDKYPDNARVNYVLSRLFYLKGDVNTSISKCKDAAECPDGASFIFVLADLYEMQHMDSLYAQTALRGFAVPDLTEEAKVQKIYEIMNRPDDMFHSANWYPFLKRVFCSLSRQYPGSADVCSLFETFYKTNGHAAQGDSLLRSFVDANPGTEYIWANIIGYAQSSGKASNALMIDFCKRAAADVPSNPLFSIYLGQYYSADNQPALGLKAFGDAFSAYDNVESSRREDFKQYRLAALNGMAMCYEKMDSLAQAFMVFDQILEDDPDDAMALNNYAYYLARAGKDLLRAEKMSMRSLNADPLNATFLDTYAYILFREQKYQEALFVMERCMENYKQGEDDGDESGAIFEHYGDILSCLGRTEEALHQWQKALKREPDNDLIKKKIDEKRYIAE